MQFIKTMIYNFLSPNTILQTKTICFQYIAKSNLMADTSFHILRLKPFYFNSFLSKLIFTRGVYIHTYQSITTSSDKNIWACIRV